MRVCLGGTFDKLHIGHKELIKTAINIAGKNGKVFIGITKSTMIKSKGNIGSFEQRKKNLKEFLSENKSDAIFEIKPITDIYGPTIEQDFDVIVVSPETKPVAEKINKKRQELGKKPIKIVIIPFVVSKDGKPVSSTRIRNKEINEDGEILRRD